MIASVLLALMTGAMPGPALDPPPTVPAAAASGSVAVGRGLTLDAAIQRALDHSPLLAAAEAGTDLGAARVEIARRSFLPRIDLEQTISRSDNPVYVFGSLLTQRDFGEDNFAIDSLNRPAALTNHQTRLVVEQALYDGGRRFLALRDARLGRDVSREDRRETAMGVVFETIRAYFGIEVNQSRVGVLDAALTAAAADLERTAARSAAGLATEADVLALRVQLADLEAQRIQARNEVELSHAQLARLLGVPLDRRFIALTGLEAGRDRLVGLREELQDLEVIAAAERPDLRRAELSEVLATAARARARSSFLPSIDFRAGREWDRPALGDDGGANWMIALSLRLRLFDGLERFARLEEAATGERQAAALRLHALEMARLEVRRAALNLRAVHAQVEVAGAAIEHARESYRITAHRYDAGLAGVTELLRGQNALVAVETRRLAALYEERLAAVAVELALGTLAPPARADEEAR